MRGIDTIEAIVAIEVIGYIVVAELPLRGIEGRAQNIESTENIRVFGGFLRARGVFLEKNDGDRGVFPVFGKTLFCVETV